MKTGVLKGLLCFMLLLCFGASADLHAQRRGGGGGGGMGGHGGFPSDRTMMRPPAPGPRNPGTNSTMRGGLQLGPPGRWWDNKDFAKTVGLRKDQQKKMDVVFKANKPTIVESYKSLQREESKLETLTKEPQPDRERIFTQIDVVNQARSSLEKANAQMLLQIRQEMDPDQLTRMDQFREKPPDGTAN